MANKTSTLQSKWFGNRTTKEQGGIAQGHLPNLQKLCQEMKVEIIEGKAYPDHIHILVSIPPHMSIVQFAGTLKSKSARMLFDRHANQKYKYGDPNFGCSGYFVDSVGKMRR